MTVTEMLLARAADDGPGLRFEDSAWTWREHVQQCADHAAVLRSLLTGPVKHVGVLADNVPSFSFLLGGCAFAGSVLVGLNPTRRGAALERDIRLSDCRLVLTEGRHAALLDGVDVPVLDLDGPEWAALLDSCAGSPLSPVPATPADLLMLIFTSGTSGDPKAVRCTHEKIALPGQMLASRFGLSGSDCVYLSMPMFHSNAIMAGWSVGLAAGAALAMRRRFSASGFLHDVLRFGATYANYVGKPLSYVLATTESPDDADNPLRIVYGNEGAEADLAEFGRRFGCHVVDAFGSTEGGMGFARTPDTPPGSLGPLPEGVAVLDPETGSVCPPGVVGELVNTAGAGAFAGYYKNPEADAERLRDGRYHTGDLAYVDENGFCFFAGRLGDWLRVDGENLGTAPIERVLLRHPAIAEAAVYAVPDPAVGDQVLAALVLSRPLSPEEFGEFLAAQPDLGPKQLPRFVRLVNELPRTSTYKIVKRRLAAEGTRCSDPVWSRRGKESVYSPTPAVPTVG
ncbi:long-chain-fatty-acid--CoA ligase [Amycolatopsis methanolica]|uniref:Acyl-CoA synthetase n=1 Tax=Amycolatopsis methanolica 239 TaxID=1068978 RepID=A0A076N4Y7_AMYME|nr:long-chain-fatty-acid--CoA ligase [Amycolatopsis methanolica]AIJ25057.1 acyl-CoA synthetase [Amycolatopsis methanolica 239]